MNKKRSIIRKITILIVSFLTTISVITIGFASWLVGGGMITSINGRINSEDFSYNYVPTSVIDNLTVDSISSAQKYGFDVNGIFTNTVNITGSGSFNVAKAKNLILTLRADGRMSLKVSLSSSSLSSSFKSNGISLTGGFSESVGETAYNTSTSSITASFTINGIVVDESNASYNASIPFNFSFNLTFTGTIGDSGNFPSFAGNNKLSLTFTPGEYTA